MNYSLSNAQTANFEKMSVKKNSPEIFERVLNLKGVFDFRKELSDLEDCLSF